MDNGGRGLLVKNEIKLKSNGVLAVGRKHHLSNSNLPSRGVRVLTHFIIGFFLIGQQHIAVAQTNIVTTIGNGWTTSANPHPTEANTTEITGARDIGGNSYNSFDHFGVASGQTANFRLNGAENLVNLVRLSRTDINGVLNSYLDAGSTIGGNVFFVNPHGITVGATGVINVGSLSMVVPTQTAMDDYISALENSGSTADERLLFVGDLKLAEDGDIDIQGTINAEGGVLL
ncbi:MAG: leukotoxin LktA family filamentous adhesin, partial [Gammaproteobacteria bacterium]|nr:leukotoxin LktA family filamentous adhesin [Gammaproteobacteria bacterium]